MKPAYPALVLAPRTSAEIGTMCQLLKEPETEVAVFNCHVCGNTAAKSEFVSEVFTVDGRRVLVEHIPAQVCERCGEAVFSRETTEHIRLLVHDTRPAKTIPLDVFALA